MVYVVSDEQPYVLAGTVGEMWLIDEKRLCKTYNFIISPLAKCKIELMKQDNNVLLVLYNKLDGVLR